MAGAPDLWGPRRSGPHLLPHLSLCFPTSPQPPASTFESVVAPRMFRATKPLPPPLLAYFLPHVHFLSAFLVTPDFLLGLPAPRSPCALGSRLQPLHGPRPTRLIAVAPLGGPDGLPTGAGGPRVAPVPAQLWADVVHQTKIKCQPVGKLTFSQSHLKKGGAEAGEMNFKSIFNPVSPKRYRPCVRAVGNYCSVSHSLGFVLSLGRVV